MDRKLSWRIKVNDIHQHQNVSQKVGAETENGCMDLLGYSWAEPNVVWWPITIV